MHAGTAWSAAIYSFRRTAMQDRRCTLPLDSIITVCVSCTTLPQTRDRTFYAGRIQWQRINPWKTKGLTCALRMRNKQGRTVKPQISKLVVCQSGDCTNVTVKCTALPVLRLAWQFHTSSNVIVLHFKCTGLTHADNFSFIFLHVTFQSVAFGNEKQLWCLVKSRTLKWKNPQIIVRLENQKYHNIHEQQLR